MKVSLPQLPSTGALSHPPHAHQLVILCHGYKSSSRQKALAIIADDLFQQGYAVYTFDFPALHPADLEAQVTVIKNIYAHFTSKYADISLIGASFGALVSSIAAAELPGLSNLITINGFFGLPRIGRKYIFTYTTFIFLAVLHARYRSTFSYYKTHFQPQAITAPTFVVHSRADKVVSIRQSRHFYKKLHSIKQFHALTKASHALSNPRHARHVAAHIHTWLQQIASFPTL